MMYIGAYTDGINLVGRTEEQLQEVTVEPVYYGHLGTNKKCPDYQGVLIFKVILYDKAAPFGTITKCVDYAGVLIFKCPH